MLEKDDRQELAVIGRFLGTGEAREELEYAKRARFNVGRIGESSPELSLVGCSATNFSPRNGRTDGVVAWLVPTVTQSCMLSA